MSENGKWQLAFWVVTVFFFVSVGTLTASVVANDRRREDEDSRIQSSIEARLEKYISQNSEQHLAIIGDLREIKAKMGISEHGVRMS